MTVLANAGPLIIIKSNPMGSVGTGSANQNPDEGANLEHIGSGLLDPRVPFTYYPGMGQFVGGGAGINGITGTPACYGFMGGDYVVTAQVPSALAAANIAGSQSPGSGAITLVTSSAAGITANVSITRADTGALVTGLLAIDNPMSGWGWGMSGLVNTWDPMRSIARNLRYSSGGVDTGITFTATGFDIYGYPMTETVTGSSGSIASGTKAFKYIQSITHTGSVASTISVGTGDVIGLPLRADNFAEVTAIFWNNSWITSSSGFTAAVTTTATATTGDVRGTVALNTLGAASNGTLKLYIYQAPSIPNLAGAQTQTVTITNASPGVVSLSANGFSNGQPVQLLTTGALPAGLNPATTYYVVAVATNTFQLATTPGGASINTSSAGSGTHTCVSYSSSNIQTGLFGVAQFGSSGNNGA